ncbi:MAG: GTP 3',8-cyclase MoaA [Thermoanaerobaculia bacterium]
MTLQDALGRPLGNLRVSVTDRCNLRCQYCMPEMEYAWLPREEILTFEEIARLAAVFSSLGVDRVRLTGGEPLVRRDLPDLVRLLAADPRLREVALTTNGVLLDGAARPLREAGLLRVTVSLDTLDPAKFRALTRFDLHRRVLTGLETAASVGFESVKIDAVIVRGVNDGELADLLAYGSSVGAEVRFIEYMDVGGATRWSMQQVVSEREIREAIERRYGPATALPPVGPAPARRYRLADGTVFGIISSTTLPFCGACDRSRLTADGTWYLCLYAARGMDLRGPLRRGAPAEEIAQLIRSAWSVRSDRGAQERLELRERRPLPVAALRADPRLEMHTRGG